MRILVTFAVEAEFAPWRKRHDFSLVLLGDLRTYRAQIAGADIVVLLTGIGGRRAGAATLGIQMIATETGRFFDVCVSTGLAGALQPEIRTGEIVVARELSTRAVRADLGKNVISCDKELVTSATKCDAREVRTFYQEDHIVITSTEKAKLSSSADVVEMESFDVISECLVWGSRGVAVRAISDLLEDDLPLNLNLAVTKTGEVSLRRILSQLLHRPKSVPALIRFGRQSRKAAESLGNFLDSFISELTVRSEAFSMRTNEVAQTT
jgi:adenosylhomocysteine nucleosidase